MVRELKEVKELPTWLIDDPLKRMLYETNRAHTALLMYRHFGSNLSLSDFQRYLVECKEKGAKVPTISWGTLIAWSAKYGWRARLERREEIQQIEDEELWAKRRQEVRMKDFAMGSALRESVQSFLEVLPKHKRQTDITQTDPKTGKVTRFVSLKLNTTMAQLAQAAKASSELQRSSTGLDDKAVQALIAHVNVSELDDEQLERLANGESLISIVTTPSKSGDRAETAKEGQSEG